MKSYKFKVGDKVHIPLTKLGTRDYYSVVCNKAKKEKFLTIGDIYTKKEQEELSGWQELGETQIDCTLRSSKCGKDGGDYFSFSDLVPYDMQTHQQAMLKEIK